MKQHFMLDSEIKKNSLLKRVSSSSDGGGRSGVYLAIDANLELAEEEDCFDVFGFLKKLRQSRKGLIENEVRSILLPIIPTTLL